MNKATIPYTPATGDLVFVLSSACNDVGVNDMFVGRVTAVYEGNVKTMYGNGLQGHWSMRYVKRFRADMIGNAWNEIP